MIYLKRRVKHFLEHFDQFDHLVYNAKSISLNAVYVALLRLRTCKS